MSKTIPITEINIPKRLRNLDELKVLDLADSIQKIGLINPITLDDNNNLLAGLHRLTACKKLGYLEIEFRVVSLNEQKKILAQIDENLIRHELNMIEKAEHIIRKEKLLNQLGLRATKRGVSKYTDMQTTEKLAKQIGSSKRMYQRIKQVAKINQKAKRILKQNDDISNNLQALIEIERLESDSLQIAVAKRIGNQKYHSDLIVKVLEDIKAVDRLKRRNGVEMIQGQRHEQDYYPTHPKITSMLLEKEEFEGNILEPACGEGHMSEVLKSAGYDVISTDLIDRGYGIGGVDFLDDKQISRFNSVDNIITNVPLKLALPFMLQSKKIAKKKIAILGSTHFLDGVERYKKLWCDKSFPLKIMYQFSGRISFAKNRIPEQSASGLVSWAWFVWDKEYTGDKPMLDWILPSPD